MADWVLVPCLIKLRAEFNALAPNRAKASDGSIGDARHQAEQSDHNDDEVGNVPIHDADKIHEVHAIDVDVDLRRPGLSMEMVVQHLLARCRSGAERRLRYIIYNRRIWQARYGWVQYAYTGPNPHDHHAHFSASYDSALEASTLPWHLEDLDMALDADDKAWISAQIKAAKTDPGQPFDLAKQSDGSWTSPAGNSVWAQGIPNGVTGGKSTAWGAVSDLGQQVMAVKALVVQLAQQSGDVDEQAIVTGVLAGLDPAAIAAAIPTDLAQRVADELHARLAA